MVKNIRLAFVESRRAGHSLPGWTAHARRSKRPVEIISEEQIEFAVVVVIEPCRGNSPEFFTRRGNASYARFRREISKSSVPVVVIENVTVESAYVEIDKPVVIVVGRCRTDAVALAAHSGMVGHIGECAVVIVMI